MNVNEIFEMNLSELTFEQFAVAMVFCFLCAALIIIIVSAFDDLGFYLFGKNKRLGGWWFKRDLYRYIGSLKHQTIKAPTEQAYHLYYNRLIGAVEALSAFGLIDNDLYLKFAAKGIPSYYDLHPEEYLEGLNKNVELLKNMNLSPEELEKSLQENAIAVKETQKKIKKKCNSKKGIYLFSGKPGSGMSCHCMPNNFEKESEANENKPTEERPEVDTDK